MIDPEKFLISESEELDLAVLNLENIDVSKIRGGTEIPCQFHEPLKWPPDLPKVGEFVLFGGFPKSKRLELAKGHLEFGSLSSGGSEIHSVQMDVITCQIQIDQCIIDFDRDGDGFSELPGISGSPVMIARQTEGGLTVFDLIGVVFEYHSGWDVLRVRPVSLIASDGTILSSVASASDA